MTCDLCGNEKLGVVEYSPRWIARCMEDKSFIFSDEDFPYDLCSKCADRIKYAGEEMVDAR